MALHLPIIAPATAVQPIQTDLADGATAYERVHLDLGTGDGKFATQLARKNPGISVIGLDTSLDHLHGSPRRHPGNVRFVHHDALDWPIRELPVAHTVTINFPYGSLLRGVVEGDQRLMARLDALLGSGSRLEIRVNQSALIVTGLNPCGAPGAIVRSLCQISGLCVSVRDFTRAELRSYPSSWSKRLGYGRNTVAFLVTARRFQGRSCPEGRRTGSRITGRCTGPEFATIETTGEIPMALHLSPKIQARITEMVEHGDYPDADTVVERALDLLTTDDRLNHLRSLVAQGAEQARRGELIEYNDQLREEAKRSALRRFAEGDSPSPDVCP